MRITKLENAGNCLIYELQANTLDNSGTLSVDSELEVQNLKLDDDSYVTLNGSDCVLRATQSATVGSSSISSPEGSNGYLATPYDSNTEQALFFNVTDCDYGGKIEVNSNVARSLTETWNTLLWERQIDAEERANILLEEYIDVDGTGTGTGNGKWVALNLSTMNVYTLDSTPLNAEKYRIFDGENFVSFTKWQKLRLSGQVACCVMQTELTSQSDYAVVSQVII